MRAITSATGYSHRLTMAAAEEVERSGAAEIDIDHLFVALVGSATQAGEVLRQSGITLDAARDAVRGQHAQQLARLGVRTSTGDGESRAVPIAGPRQVQWNEHARQLFARASSDPTGLTLLRALLEESSQFVRDAVRRLDIEPDSLLAAARRSESDPDRMEPSAPGELSVTFFIPAPAEAIWNLVDDPRRRPEWDSSVASIEEAADGDTWIASYQPAPGAGAAARRWDFSMRVAQRDMPRLYEWMISWPAHGRPRAVNRLRLELSPDDGGTMARLSVAREQAKGLWRVRQVLLGPISRTVAWLQLSRTASSLTRAVQQRKISDIRTDEASR